MGKSVVLIANGILQETEWMRPLLEAADLIGAIDGGANYLYTLDHLPDWILGDFDSIEATTRCWSSGVLSYQYPAAKDFTDLELGIQQALDDGATDITILGGTGGRLDQELGNLFLLFHPDYAHLPMRFVEPSQTTFAIHNSLQISGKIGQTISFLPLSDEVKIVSTSGLKWPIQNELLPFGYSRTISNQFDQEVVEVVVAFGRLLCVIQHP